MSREKWEEDAVISTMIEIFYRLMNQGVSAERIFDFIENDDKYKNIFSCEAEVLIEMLHNGSLLEFTNTLAFLISGENISCDFVDYNNVISQIQAKEVALKLVFSDGYDSYDALKIWLMSDTKKRIQDIDKARIVGFECYRELQEELKNKSVPYERETIKPRPKMCNLVSMVSGTGETIQVADIKVKYIENIIRSAPLCKYIKKIVLFGSSIREDCTEYSDIDIAVFGNAYPSRVLLSASYRKFHESLYDFDISQNYDVLYFKSSSPNNFRIMEDIKKGAILYERK